MTNPENNGLNFLNNSCLQRVVSICDRILCIMASVKQMAELESVLRGDFAVYPYCVFQRKLFESALHSTAIRFL